METSSNTSQFLECSVGENHYLLACAEIGEVIPLPALTTIPGSNSLVAGLLNLRGEVLEVLNGKIVLGTAKLKYQRSDRVIIIRLQEKSFGLIVESTHHVKTLNEDHLDTSQFSEAQHGDNLIQSLAHTLDGLIPVLDPSALLQLLRTETRDGAVPKSFFDCMEEHERLEFQARLNTFSAIETSAQGMSNAYAVIELGGERYGVDLKQVTEFLEVESITPVPCCPSYVVGNMNWRGDVLTILDVSSALDLPESARSLPQKLMVFGQKRDAIGVVVDQIFDVCHLQESQIRPAPSTFKTAKEGYLSGIAEYKDHQLGILGVEHLLTPEKWCVKETV